jgi:hypothetical protein
MVYTVLDQDGKVEAIFRTKKEAEDYKRISTPHHSLRRMKKMDADELFESQERVPMRFK